MWIEYGCEEKEDQESKKFEEMEKMFQAQRIQRKEDMNEQLHQHELKKRAVEEEERHERLWVRKKHLVFNPSPI